MEDQEPKENQRPDGTKPQESPVVAEGSASSTQQDTPEGNTEESLDATNVAAPGIEGASLQSTTPGQETKNEEAKPKKSVNTPLIILVIIVTGVFTALAIFCAMLLSRGNDTEQGNIAPVEPNISEPVPLDDFGFEFIKLEKEEGKNIIYSPLSIKYALAMLSDATDGESKAQIDNLVGDMKVEKYANNDKQSLANAMFVKDEEMYQVKDSYIQTLEQKYNASVIADPFTSETPLNDWVSGKTFGLINNLFDNSVLDSDFVLVNALAIDMNWNNKLQCSITSAEDTVPCMWYNTNFIHENYRDSVRQVGLLDGDDFDVINFNGQEARAAQIGASANNYDIVSELGEDYIRSTVQTAYDEWLAKAQADENYPTDYDISFDMDKYIEELNSNYGATASSTDFYFSDTDTEKVFAKDLQENEGSTLQYIGIMPKTDSLNTYIEGITAEKIANIVSNLNDVSTIDGFKEGVLTKISAHIPFFDFDYQLKLRDDLNTLGVTDVFIQDKADLSQMTSTPKSYIQDALHKANIDFSNDGIRAAAATALPGGFGAGGPITFDYEWDIPVEEIDLTFDKSFFFIIRDKATGEVWFTGSVYNPAK